MSSSTTTLGQHRSAFVMAEATDHIQATGVVQPRITFELRVRTPSERVQAEIHNIRLQVRFGSEVLGEGTSVGDFVDSHDRRIVVEVPVSRAALGFVNERINAERLDLVLSLRGWMRVRYELAEGETTYSEPPGEWWFTTFGVAGMSEISLTIARGEWFKRVLEPLGSYEYLLTEVPLLKSGTTPGLIAARRQLQEAERHFAEGSDPAVFQHCKGIVEALPGWPKEIFRDVPDTNKARRLDDLVLAAKQYYDHGRHIARTGAQEGEFPVNHREALFALNMAKVLLAEVTALIAGP